MPFINNVHIILLAVVFAIMLGDIASGLVKCYLSKSEKSKDGNFKSSIMKRCGLKKILTILFIVGVDVILGIFEFSNISAAVYYYYIFVEAFSILENLSACGVPIPKFFRNFLETQQIEKGVEENEDN